MKRILFELSTFRTAGVGTKAGDAGSPPEFSPLALGRFRKELIREGSWVHPTRNFRLSVSKERMSRWVEKFRLMQKRGIRVPVPFGHSYDPKDNAGFVEALELEGNALVAVLNIPRPEDAQKLGHTVKDVSISINPDFRDGQGRRYGEVIEHVALTTRPVVSGQSDFLPLTLPDGSPAEVWLFSVERLKPREVPVDGERQDDGPATGAGSEPPVGEAEKEPTGPPRLELDPEEFRRQFELPEGTEPERMFPAAVLKYQACKEQADGDGAPDDGEQPDDAATVDQGAGDQPGPVDLELAELRTRAVERELEGLLRSGRLTPAMRGPALRLLALREPVSLQLADGQAELDVAAELRALLEAVPEYALIDLRERTLFEAPKPVGEMTDERAAKLAAENRQLAKLAT